MIKQQTVHFTIGEDMGIILMEIAQEHLLYDLNPNKAIKTITESLMGCSDDMAIKIVKGDIVLMVDVDMQMVLPTKRKETIHDMFPKLEIKDWCLRKCDDIHSVGKGLKISINTISNKIRFGRKLSVDLTYEEVVKFIVSGNKELIEEKFYELEEVDEISCLVKIVKEYIEHSMKIQSVMNWMFKTYSVEFDEQINNDINEANEMLSEVSTMFADMCSANIIKTDTKELDKYIESAIEIGKVLSEEIQPVDIFKNYSAGWLSPDGRYYALNGEIANMLHIQIAQALQDIGQIPLYEGSEDEQFFLKGNEKTKADRAKVNPDGWLEKQGWVKIHDNNINFAGCLNDKLGEKNVDMTNVQIDLIYKYIQLCHNSIMRLGWKQIQISASRFQMTAENNMYELNKTYFEF